ncbi:hypothetical protein ACLOJK_026051 [Asimina triloba]
MGKKPVIGEEHEDIEIIRPEPPLGGWEKLCTGIEACIALRKVDERQKELATTLARGSVKSTGLRADVMTTKGVVLVTTGLRGCLVREEMMSSC